LQKTNKPRGKRGLRKKSQGVFRGGITKAIVESRKKRSTFYRVWVQGNMRDVSLKRRCREVVGGGLVDGAKVKIRKKWPGLGRPLERSRTWQMCWQPRSNGRSGGRMKKNGGGPRTRPRERG